MTSCCDFCGCKTEAMDLKGYRFESGTEVELCDFCRKRLMQLKKNPEENLEWLKGLPNVKGVSRKSECEDEIKNLLKQYNVVMEEMAEKAEIQKEIPGQFPKLQQEVEALKAQVESLQKDYRRFKKFYLYSKILGIVLPIIIFIIALVIMLSSGSLGNIVDYYGDLSEYANM